MTEESMTATENFEGIVTANINKEESSVESEMPSNAEAMETEEPYTDEIGNDVGDISEGDGNNLSSDYEDTKADDEDYLQEVSSSADEDYISDLSELKNQFPTLGEIRSISELESPSEYQRFRSLGLTPREALLATGQSPKPPAPKRPTSPIAVKTRGERIPDHYLKMAREIFTGLSDREIQALYKKVK